jgi:sugar lactone lactonase YvrE
MRIQIRSAVFVILLTIISPLEAADLIYVSLLNGSVVTYDTTGIVGSTIAATQTTFASIPRQADAMGLAFDSGGNLYVASSGDTVSKFSSSGAYLSSIGNSSNLRFPWGLAIDSLDNLYVANYKGYNISKFDYSGNHINNIDLDYYMPWGLTVDSSYNIYVANSGFVSKFDSSGNHIANISENLGYASSVTLDSSGNLYVSNYAGSYAYSINKYSSSGRLLSTIRDRSLDGPFSLAFDSSGNLYVSNHTGRSISKFSPSGKFLLSWSTGADNPTFLAFKPVSVPEPSTYALATIAVCIMTYLVSQRR